MRLLNKLFGGGLAPAWEISPGATVWKLEVTRAGRLVGEARDVEAKRVSLFSIELESGSLLFSGRALDESWWVALDSVVGEVAIMHRYPKPDMPNVRGVTAIDVGTGEQLWSNESLRVVCGTEEILLAQLGASADAPSLVFVDARTGATLGQADESSASAFIGAADDAARWSGWTSAEALAEDDPRHRAISSIVDRTIDDRRGAIELAEHGDYTVVASYARSKRSADAMLQGLVDNILLVVRDGRIIYRETIASGLPAVTSDSFFIRNGMLFYVRNGSTLVAVPLGD